MFFSQPKLLLISLLSSIVMLAAAISPMFISGQHDVAKRKASFSLTQEEIKLLVKDPTSFIALKVADPYAFRGMAGYLSDYRIFQLNKSQAPTSQQSSSESFEKPLILVEGRFKILLLNSYGFTLSKDGEALILSQKNVDQRKIAGWLVPKQEFGDLFPDLEYTRYSYLIWPLAKLCLVFQHSITGLLLVSDNPLLSLLLFLLLLKGMLLPLSKLSNNINEKVNKTKRTLDPIIAEIKSEKKGEEAHNQIIQAYKNLGISPFYRLKTFLGLSIQIPIWICMFNILGEMSQFDVSQTGFGSWAYPDALSKLQLNVWSDIGFVFSVFPLCMAFVYFLVIFYNRNFEGHAESGLTKPLVVAFTCLIIFYPFPAIMVLYWTLSIVLQWMEKSYITQNMI